MPDQVSQFGFIMTHFDTAPAAKVSLRHASRDSRLAARRQQILSAALEVFSVQGYEVARLEDVAKRAGVARGTIYLHFPDKEALFLEVIRTALLPMVDLLKVAVESPLPARAILELAADSFVREVYHTNRKNLLRLIFLDGARLPEVMRAYYRDIVVPVNDAIASLLRRAFDRGEITQQGMARFPQLLVAPWAMAIMWRVMFEPFQPLDVHGLLRAHIDQVFAGSAGSGDP